MIVIFENGKAARFELAGFATKTNRRRLTGAYSDRSPAKAFFHFSQDCNITLFATNGRALTVNTSVIPPKSYENDGRRADNGSARQPYDYSRMLFHGAGVCTAQTICLPFHSVHRRIAQGRGQGSDDLAGRIIRYIHNKAAPRGRLLRCPQCQRDAFCI